MIDTSKIIHGVVGGGRYTVTSPIVKEDYGLYLLIEGLELPSTYEVDFSNSEHNGTSVTMIGNSDGVLIPHQFIDSGKDIFAFLYHVGVDFGRTVYKFRIPNKVRPDRTNEQPTPEQQSVIDQAIAALNDAVEQTAQDVASAHEYAQASASNAESASASAQSADASREAADESEYNAQVYAENAQASATASAQSASQSAQIKDDVESMVDDAQGYASASAQSATASANSASQALSSAQSASASASSAQGYASQAQTSANTASSKASEASQSASTASAKATESAQSASQALTYKTDAESAKTASQTAQGLAESARDNAQGYASDAQGYANDAQASAESISASASQIAKNSADILKAFPTDTASGAVASFSDGADNIPLKSLIVNIDPVQDLSQGDPSPTNICPISGWTEVDVEQSGKNLLDFKAALDFWNCNYTENADGSFTITSLGTAYSNPYRFVKGNTIISASAESIVNGSSAAGWGFDLVEESGSAVAQIRANNLVQANKTACKIRLNYSTSGNGCTIKAPQIELGSTATPYEPYTGRSITIDLGQTVYGGTLNVLTGELVVDRGYKLFNGSEQWILQSTNSYGICNYMYTDIRSEYIGSDNVGAICNRFAPQTSSIAITQASGFYLNNGGYLFIRIPSTIASTVDEFKTWLADHNVQLTYALKTPIEIQLSANQINSLLGVNNIWADTGDTTAEYRADTKLFIERLTAPDSADMIADANITSGQYFMVGNNLYKATANIASGASVIVGTNCTRKSLSEALNEINA